MELRRYSSALPRSMLCLLPFDDFLSSAYIHQFFMFGAGLFISEVYLGQYPSRLVGGIWMEAQERKSVHSRSRLDRLTNPSLATRSSANGSP
jgi:hypothetical protein